MALMVGKCQRQFPEPLLAENIQENVAALLQDATNAALQLFAFLLLNLGGIVPHDEPSKRGPGYKEGKEGVDLRKCYCERSKDSAHCAETKYSGLQLLQDNADPCREVLDSGGALFSWLSSRGGALFSVMLLACLAKLAIIVTHCAYSANRPNYKQGSNDQIWRLQESNEVVVLDGIWRNKLIEGTSDENDANREGCQRPQVQGIP